jgi:hypothetical protein
MRTRRPGEEGVGDTDGGESTKPRSERRSREERDESGSEDIN